MVGEEVEVVIVGFGGGGREQLLISRLCGYKEACVRLVDVV